jgi:hypothetical protein
MEMHRKRFSDTNGFNLVKKTSLSSKHTLFCSTAESSPASESVVKLPSFSCEPLDKNPIRIWIKKHALNVGYGDMFLTYAYIQTYIHIYLLKNIH